MGPVLTPVTGCGDLGEALSEHTTERSAAEYVGVLQGLGLGSLSEVLTLTSDDLKGLHVSPHLRFVLRRVRKEPADCLEGTPLDGYVTRNLFSADNAMPAFAVLFLMNFVVGGDSFFSLLERLFSMAVLCVILAVLLVRSFYLLLAEEEIGQLRVTRKVDPQTGKPETAFSVRVTVHGKGGGTAGSASHDVRTSGDDIGVLVHEVVLHPILVYLGVSSRLSWSAVQAIDQQTQAIDTAITLTHVSTQTWTALEAMPFIPGIRGIQRSLVHKTAPDGAHYLVKKDPHGRVWLQQAVQSYY